MKPIQLTVQAFGPFAGKQQIQFDALGNNPLFLINGATGAGKSSILDAICFALYGHTTGAERSASQMRCDFADTKLLTEVTLDFSLADKRYRISRVPMQERAKSVGEGTTTQQSKASLWELDGTPDNRLIVSSSVKDADAEIKQLIGLDVEQFRQVMVLPQGKFRELLLADSKDREKIFSQLFQTSIYKKIEEALKAQASDIKKSVEQHQNQIKGILQSADVNCEAEIMQGIEQIEPELALALSAKTSADNEVKKLEKAFNSAQQLLNKFNSLEQKVAELAAHQASGAQIDNYQAQLNLAGQALKLQPVFNRKIDIAKKLADAKQKLVDSQAQLAQASLNNTQSQASFEKALSALQAVEPSQKQLVELEQYKKLANDFSLATSQVTHAKKQAEESKSKLKTAQLAIENIHSQIVSQEAKIEQFTHKISDLALEQVKLDKLSQSLEKRVQLANLNAELIKLSQQTATAKQALDAAEVTRLEKHQSAIKTEMLWHSNQAAILAKELNDGEPCPVCGSLEHPNVALMTSEESADNDVITKDDVEAARALLTTATTAREQAKLNYDQALNQEKIKESLIDELSSSITDIAMYSVDEVKTDHQAQVTKVKQLLAIRKQLQLAKENLTINKETLNAESQAIKSLEAQANTDNERYIALQSKVSQLEQQIPENHRDIEKLTHEITQLVTTIKALNDDLDLSRKAKELAQSQFAQADAQHKALTKQLTELEQENTHTVNEWNNALASSIFDDDEHFNRSILLETAQNELTLKVDAYKTQLATLSGARAQLEADLKDQTKPELNTLAEQVEQAKLLFKEKDQSWQLLAQRKNQLVSVQNKLTEAHKKNEQLEQQYRVVGTLYEISNGLTGDKVSLQRFVLSVLLDDVLIQASQRLTLMSKGRYQLIRKEQRAKGNKASGLELEVDDAYTGKSRPVATLSGGESFMAALSLALGLSDVVQSYSGGIKLDTLFIDEGFGSLDPESLDLAVSTLIDLQSTGRMIGIISHVSELKSQMGLRIDVNSGKAGSEISMSLGH